MAAVQTALFGLCDLSVRPNLANYLKMPRFLKIFKFPSKSTNFSFVSRFIPYAQKMRNGRSMRQRFRKPLLQRICMAQRRWIRRLLVQDLFKLRQGF